MARHDDALLLSEMLTTAGGEGIKDLLREVVRDALQELIEEELTATIGAAKHERTDSRTAQRKVGVTGWSRPRPATGGGCAGWSGAGGHSLMPAKDGPMTMLAVVGSQDGWQLGGCVAGCRAVNRFLAHLVSRGFAAATVRAFACDTLNFARFCVERGLGLSLDPQK